MKKSENYFEKLFAGIGFTGSSRVPIRSNVYKTGRGGFSPIGQTGQKMFNADRESPLLGNAQPSNRLSGYYERVSELKNYQQLDISKLSVGLFRDYVLNFLIKDSKQLVTIQDDEGNNVDEASERINEILTKDLEILDYISSHCDDKVYWGSYSSILESSRDETGHLRFRLEELYDPTSVVIKKKKNKDGQMSEIYLARGEDGNIYEIPGERAFMMGSSNLRLINDLDDNWKDKSINKPSMKKSNKKGETPNLDKVLKTESYMASEPLFYSNVLKVKELVVKEILVSLISLRDLSSPSLYGLSIDKGIPLEVANNLCAKIQKLSTNTNELASFLTAQFDVVSFIESSLVQNVKFFPDYNATLSNKNAMMPLDKLSDKMIEIMQMIDTCRQSVLSPLGIPSSITESATGSKWAILQQSERANSRVATLMSDIDKSIVNLAVSLYKRVYGEDLNPSSVKTHIFEKSTVEYNNQINQAESINSLISGLSTVIQTSIGILDSSGPLLDTQTFLSYVQTLVKDIDPTTGDMITDETIQAYVEYQQQKFQASKEQLGIG